MNGLKPNILMICNCDGNRANDTSDQLLKTEQLLNTAGYDTVLVNLNDTDYLREIKKKQI
ncbi:MAG: ABC-type ATPase involved in cell division [Phenylobacterium sp.]|jgi:ABC-type ATPase involved in cell division